MKNKCLDRRTLYFTFLILTCLGLASQSAFAQASALWGDLQPGPNPVGFRTLFTYDVSRAAVASDSGTRAAPGRQMQINIWYPARRAARSEAPMRFEEYVHLLAREVDFSPVNSARARDANEKFVRQARELGGNAENLRAAVPRGLKMPTRAIKDAPLASGRFPVVVYLNAPAQNSILCEYLASHGYVVAAAPIKGVLEHDFEAGLGGIEAIAADIQFLAGELKRWKNADADKLAYIGLGIVASGALSAQMRNPQVDALISLDGGIPTLFEDRLLKRTPYFDLGEFRIPMLAIHAPHPNVDPSILDQYKYSTRHYVHFPKMSEFHFLNYGILEKFVPDVIGKAPGDTKAGFEWAARYVVMFLDTYLKHDTRAASLLSARPADNAVPAGLLLVDKKTALEPPPRLHEIKQMVRRGGFQSVQALYRERQKLDPQPFPQDLLVRLFSWLSQGNDDGWQHRREVALMRVESFPGSTRAHFSLAQVSMQVNDRETARKHYEQALSLLPTDADPLFNSEDKARIQRIATQNLETIKK